MYNKAQKEAFMKEYLRNNVDIHTEHNLFGKQHIQMKFVPETEAGWVGSVCVDRQFILIKMILFHMMLTTKRWKLTEK